LPAEDWVPVLSTQELPEDRAVRVWAKGLRLIVGRRAGDTPFAALDSCPHLDLPLAAFGPVQLRRARIVCPWHFWEFDAGTGRCEYAPIYADDEIFFFQLEGASGPRGAAAGCLQLFPARVRRGVLEVRLSGAG
jgi:nitrite reductase/ring-hydroxylating ferredoxin subunit